MRLWVHKKANELISFEEPENAQDWFFCMDLTYYLFLLDEIQKTHKKHGDAREAACVAKIIKAFKDLRHA